MPLAKETDHKLDMASTSKPSKAKQAISSGTKSSKHNRPLLIRQHSDEHQNALIEKVFQEMSLSSSQSKKDKSSKKTVLSQTTGRSSSSKNMGKLRKMGALECPVPTDIVYEEGDSNKVPPSATFEAV